MSSVPPNYSIFNALHEVIAKKGLKKLRFAKCLQCGRLTPYRLKALELPEVACKSCGTSIPITR